MRRRDFIALVGAATAWPFAAPAQQKPRPVVGYLVQGTPEGTSGFVDAVRKGLAEAGLIEGKDFSSEFRFAYNDADRLPGLATDLVQRQSAIIIAVGTTASARAAKAATTEIPIVFAVGADAVQTGLVASLNHPGGNVTGISSMSGDLGSKWVGLLHELLPSASRIAVLVNLDNGDAARAVITGTQAGAMNLGLQIEVLFASSVSEIDSAFAGLGTRVQALIVQPELLFTQNLGKLAELAIREKLASLYPIRQFPQAGGLMSYGSSFTEVHHQAGVYAGRILKGEKPAELPVQLATKFDFVINLKTAKAIGLQIPNTMLAVADDVIE